MALSAEKLTDQVGVPWLTHYSPSIPAQLQDGKNYAQNAVLGRVVRPAKRPQLL